MRWTIFAWSVGLALAWSSPHQAAALLVDTVDGRRVEGRLSELRDQRVVLLVRGEDGGAEREMEIPLDSIDVMTRWAGADRRLGGAARLEAVKLTAPGANAVAAEAVARVTIGPIVIRGGRRVPQAMIMEAAPAARPEMADAARVKGEAALPGLAESGSGAADVKTWRIVMANGDQIDAALEAWSGDRIEIRAGALSETSLKPATAQVRQIWRPSHAPPPDASLPLTEEEIASGLDVALATTPENLTARVAGRAVGIEGDQLIFRHKDKDQRIALSRLIGLVRAAPAGATTQLAAALMGHQVVRLQDGQVVRGRWTGVMPNSITLRTQWDQDLSIGQDRILELRSLNGAVARLADLTPVSVEQTPYFDRVMPYRRNQNFAGTQIVLGETAYNQGLAMHARSVLTYDLPAGFDRLRAAVGFEQPAGRGGRAIIRVLADGKVLHEQSDARGDQPPTTLDLPITGVRRLSLEVNFGAEQDTGDRVLWGDPRLMKGKPAER